MPKFPLSPRIGRKGVRGIEGKPEIVSGNDIAYYCISFHKIINVIVTLTIQ